MRPLEYYPQEKGSEFLILVAIGSVLLIVSNFLPFIKDQKHLFFFLNYTF